MSTARRSSLLHTKTLFEFLRLGLDLFTRIRTVVGSGGTDSGMVCLSDGADFDLIELIEQFPAPVQNAWNFKTAKNDIRFCTGSESVDNVCSKLNTQITPPVNPKNDTCNHGGKLWLGDGKYCTDSDDSTLFQLMCSCVANNSIFLKQRRSPPEQCSANRTGCRRVAFLRKHSMVATHSYLSNVYKGMFEKRKSPPERRNSLKIECCDRIWDSLPIWHYDNSSL